MAEKINEAELVDELNEIFEPPPESIIPAKVESCLPDVVVEKVSISTTNEKSHDELAEDDFNYSRQNLHDVIDVGVQALQSLSLIAKDATSARYHEVIGELMKNIADSTKELFELHQKMKLLKKDTIPIPGGDTNITNNNLIVTTNELLQMIKNYKK